MTVPARILVVEDDPASLELLTYLLRRAGHTVRSETDGAAGLRAALENDCDIVLCDLQLPELNGHDVAGSLRASPGWRPIPIIAVTAYSMPGDRDAAIAAGFTDHMTKPVDPESFLRKFNSFLPAELRSGPA